MTLGLCLLRMLLVFCLCLVVEMMVFILLVEDESLGTLGYLHPLIEHYPPPTAKEELMSFPGLLGLLPNFCPVFSTVVVPLNGPCFWIAGVCQWLWCGASAVWWGIWLWFWALQHFSIRVGSNVPLVLYRDQGPIAFLNSMHCPNHRFMQWFVFADSLLPVGTVFQRDQVQTHWV